MFLFRSTPPQTKQAPALSGIQFQTSVYGKCIPICFGTNRLAPNVIWYGDFRAKKVKQSGGGGKGGSVGGGSTGKGGAVNTSYTYFTSLAYGLCEGPVISFGSVWINQNITTLAAQGFSSFLGTYPQTPWSYLTTNHPSEALGYNGLSYVAVTNYSLGNNSQLPNHNFEIYALRSNSVSGKNDADPSLVISDLLTNAVWGVGFPSAYLGTLTNYQNYCLAAGLLISPFYTTQQQCQTMLEDIAKNTNSEFVFSSGKLTLVPYGDAALMGNGKTYTPPAAPIYDITDDDYIFMEGEDPIRLVRKRQSDAINSMKLEYNDRNKSYNLAIAEAKDQASIDLYGLRQDSSGTAHMFCDETAANTSCQLQLQRQQIRNTYTFTLDQRFILLDPMDIVSVNDLGLSLDAQWVRILEIEEDDNFNLLFTVEEYLNGTGSAPLYAFESGSGFTANYNEDPGLPNTPIVFEPPVQISLNTGLETWLCVSGGEKWGGCDVYISSDDATYKFIGRITGSARTGVLTSALPMGSDPDIINTLTVDLSESAGELGSGTIDDADKGNTLCYVDGELIAYETATLTAANQYSLTYLRRGMFGGENESHSSGTQFARLDNEVLAYPYAPDQIGQTIYIKFCGFNLYGGGQQGLADVDSFTHVILGPPNPGKVEDFKAEQQGDTVAFEWQQITSSFALKGYDIGFAPLGSTDWADFTLLTEALRGTEMTNASVPFGDWTFGIRARDIADQLSLEITYYDLTVVNLGNVLELQENAPDWLGTVSGFIVHWTGILIPDDQFAMAHYTTYGEFDTFIPNPVSSAYYIAPTIDIGYDDNVRVFGTIDSLNAGGTTGAPTEATSLDHWKSGEVDPGIFDPWTNEYVTLRYAKMKMEISGITSGNANYYTLFDVEIDRAENTSQSGTQTVLIGGTTVTYPTPFHRAPAVQGTAISTGGLVVTCSPITATDFVARVFDITTGLEVGGDISWTATGE